MGDSFLGDATGMGENLEAVTAGDGDERDAGGFGGADSKSGGRRYGDDDWHAHDSRRRPSRTAALCVSASHIRNSIPISLSTMSSCSMSSSEDTIPSVRLKPQAKSSKSCGVAIMTA